MSNGQEFYPTGKDNKQKYATDRNKNQFYVTHYKKDSENNEVYETHNGRQVYAKDENDKPYYAKKANLSEFYAKDENDNGYYIRTKEGDVYALNENKEEIYASKADKSQIYGKDRNNRPKFVTRGTQQIYAQDADGNDVYPRNAQGKCIMARNNNVRYYAKVKGKSVYPTDENNNQYVVNNVYIVDENGKTVLPLSQWGSPMYKKDAEGNEIYETDASGQIIFGKDKWGIEMYAKTKDLDEYYPLVKGEPVFAKAENMDKYALDKNNLVIYPEKNNEKFYIIGSNEMLVKYFDKYIPGQYPIMDSGRDLLINNEYNEDPLGFPYYPLDENMNQYTLMTKSPLISDYPVTNDGFVIIPNYYNEPVYATLQTHTESMIGRRIIEKDIVGLLLRGGNSYDFLTNIKTNKNSALFPYKTLSLLGDSTVPIYLNRTVQCIVGFLIFIILLLIVF